MDNAYWENLRRYLAAVVQAGRMLERGIITGEEYGKFDTIIAKKYGINSCSIFRPDSLLKPDCGGNMSR